MAHYKNVNLLDNWVNSFDPSSVNDVFEASSFSNFVVSPRLKSKSRKLRTIRASPDTNLKLKKLLSMEASPIEEKEVDLDEFQF